QCNFFRITCVYFRYDFCLPIVVVYCKRIHLLPIGSINMNIKQWIFSSLRTKLIFMFVILMATPLIFVGIISYIKSYNTISKHAVASAVLEAERLKRDIDLIFQDTVIFSEMTKLESVIHFLS